MLMTDLKKINYYVVLAMSILWLVLGVMGFYILLTSPPTGGGMWLRGVVGAPALTILGLYGLYWVRKEGRDISVVPNREK